MKKIFSLLVTFIILLSLTSCQQTPDDALVAQKDQDRLASAAAETAAKEDSLKSQKENTPDNYTFQYENEEKTLKITADVPVIMPENDTLSTYRVSSGYFPQEMVTQVYDYLFPDRETYIFSGTDRTKSVIEEEILRNKQMMAEVEEADNINDVYKQDSIDDIQSIIADLEKEYEEAPEKSTKTPVPVDSTLLENDGTSIWGDGDYYLHCETLDGAIFNVNNYPSHLAGGSTIYYNSKYYNDTVSEIKYTDPSPGSENCSIVTQKQAIKESAKIPLSYEDAKNTAEQFFKAIGIETSLQQIYLVKGEVNQPEETGLNKYLPGNYLTSTYESNFSAYGFTFFRAIENVEITGMKIGTYSTSIASEYTVRWEPETINLVISSNGIEVLEWEEPFTIGEKISGDAGFLSFDEASAIFEKMMPVVYLGRLEAQSSEKNQYAYNIDVTEVKLCLMPIRDNGEEKSGLLIPAWVFYGDWREKKAGDPSAGQLYDPSTRPYMLMAVNAIDGTVIDPMKGY